ncbi:MAG: hypothetical protein COU65_03765 [Candidatus Pacebacteria bacterium CG10_big_fil_rev_8_21_14_0_10_42_12]|nr:MAG: hypothetical protein COU65_03765 [Candidatus Pacebacteria bacterium CG10_big_fil_rev_8_21_14_0_10_42_12]
MKNILQSIHAQADLNLFLEANNQKLPGRNNIPGIDYAQVGLGVMVGRVLTIAMTIAALMVLVNLIWAAMEWITSGGDTGKLESSRARITQSVIGIIVLASVVAIFSLLQAFLGIEVLTFNFG